MRWCHPILFDVIQELWFARSSSDGVKYAQAFGTRIPAPTIALVFTAVRVFFPTSLLLRRLLTTDIRSVTASTSGRLARLSPSNSRPKTTRVFTPSSCLT